MIKSEEENIFLKEKNEILIGNIKEIRTKFDKLCQENSDSKKLIDDLTKKITEKDNNHMSEKSNHEILNSKINECKAKELIEITKKLNDLEISEKNLRINFKKVSDEIFSKNEEILKLNNELNDQHQFISRYKEQAKISEMLALEHKNEIKILNIKLNEINLKMKDDAIKEIDPNCKNCVGKMMKENSFGILDDSNFNLICGENLYSIKQSDLNNIKDSKSFHNLFNCQRSNNQDFLLNCDSYHEYCNICLKNYYLLKYGDNLEDLKISQYSCPICRKTSQVKYFDITFETLFKD